MIQVTKTYLPDFDTYVSFLKKAWDRAWITNHGPLVIELEEKLKEKLSIPNFLYTSNGTVVLQMALKVYGITKEVVTTPFSYVATTNAILWENCTPVFADILPTSLCIDPDSIERKITENTQAILATHVYGYPCDVDKIETLANKYNLKVIYDAAHAFGAEYKGKSLLSFGDISTCSFHATKIFHTVEGGCIVANDTEVYEKLKLMRSFGHIGDDYYCLGINAKNSEFHAAMGLSIFPDIENIIAKRKFIIEHYKTKLSSTHITFPQSELPFKSNYAYFPVLFNDENTLLKIRKALMNADVNTRRYFYPSLNNLPYIAEPVSCPNSDELSKRVLCLPLYYDLELDQIDNISAIINSTLM